MKLVASFIYGRWLNNGVSGVAKFLNRHWLSLFVGCKRCFSIYFKPKITYGDLVLQMYKTIEKLI